MGRSCKMGAPWPGIRGVLPIRGGWGTSRLLPYLDFDVIRRNPKVVLGFSDITALVFGTCDECGPGEGYGSLTLEEVLDDHVRPLNVPSWRGAMIGHNTPQFTLPVGGEVEIDATKATIRMVEPAVL